MNGSRVSLLRILADLFVGRERWMLFGLLAVSIVAAAFEVASVASILPFMMLVLDPSAIDRYAFVHATLRSLGVTTTQGALIAAGVATGAVIAAGNLAGAANVYMQQWFMARTETRLSATLFAGYLRQPYAFHVQRDAPSLFKVLDTDVHHVVGGVISPFAVAVSRVAVAAGILLLLVVRDPLVAMWAAVLLVGAYTAVFRAVRSRQHKLAAAGNDAGELRMRISQEGFGGIKELQVLGRLDFAISSYRDTAAVVARARALSQAAAQIPRYALETIAFGGILLVTLEQIAYGSKGAQTIVPVLALYAFAGYRLLPAFQNAFASATSIRFSRPALETLHADFVQVVQRTPEPSSLDLGNGEMNLRHQLRLDSVSFSYEGAARPALDDITLVIQPRESIGLVGRTGAGKTTLADVVLGLYQPDAGSITVDGIALNGPALQAWRKRVGYVPQSVFLANASVAANIAFGVYPDAIDRSAVERAARAAQVEEFIAALPNGYDTLVGERGVKLSGGQRQRIGIARALYHEPDVLVFDEATSALDGLTEDAVMDAIRSLAHGRTVILIAHRLRTVEACDRIVMLDRGQVVACGPYDLLLRTSTAFRQLVGRQIALVSGMD